MHLDHGTTHTRHTQRHTHEPCLRCEDRRILSPHTNETTRAQVKGLIFWDAHATSAYADAQMHGAADKTKKVTATATVRGRWLG